MPLEPKKPIEELLETSAKARRASFGADPKMPNPMRARLHDEIACATRQDEPETRAHSWISWPRLAFTAALAALVIGAPLGWWRSQQPAAESFRLATNQPATANESSADSAAANKLANPAQASGANPSALKKFGDVAMAPSTSVASVAQATNLRQRFSQTTPRERLSGDKSKQERTASVLNTFQLEQNGAEIRIVDTDGSTYVGKIESLAENKDRELRRDEQDKVASVQSRAARSEVAAPKPAEIAEANANQFFFRATGRSSSLKKPLVFEGIYIATPSPQQNAAAPSGTINEQGRARVVGTAIIHGESPVPVDAASIAR